MKTIKVTIKRVTKTYSCNIIKLSNTTKLNTTSMLLKITPTDSYLLLNGDHHMNGHHMNGHYTISVSLLAITFYLLRLLSKITVSAK
jgi:hypothetical protein